MPPAKRQPTKAYNAHRERQRRRILDAAKTLFDEKGVDPVTMAEITTASGVRASTIYQYFSSKDDVVWAIAGEVLASGADTVEVAGEQSSNALSRISAVLEFLADQLATRRKEVSFMAQFDAMYARDWPAERLLDLESTVFPQGFDYFSQLVRDGIADGSLNPDLDPDLTMHAVLNFMIGGQRRLASLGNKVELEYGQPVDRLFREMIRVVLLGLRSPQPPRPTQPLPRPNSTKRTSKRSIR